MIELEPHERVKFKDGIDPYSVSEWLGFYQESSFGRDLPVEKYYKLESRELKGEFFLCSKAKVTQTEVNFLIHFHMPSLVKRISTYFLAPISSGKQPVFIPGHSALDENLFERDVEAWERRLAAEKHFQIGDLIVNSSRFVVCTDIKYQHEPEHVKFDSLMLREKTKYGMYCFGLSCGAYKEVFIPWGLAEYVF